jgi:hypothetical protein
MKIEDQVCSLELSKRLKELGVKQDSLFGWFWSPQIDKWSVEPIIGPFTGISSAFTVAELGIFLPDFIDFTKIKNAIHVATLYGDDIQEENNVSVIDDTEANVRAKMLIQLIENDYVKGEDL